MPDRLHVIQHVPYETPAHIGWWALQNGWQLVRIQLHEDEPLPEVDDLQALVVLGGPMSVNDEAEHPWLVDEKALIEEAIEERVPVLGVCLGAQLIADVLGATVHPADQREVGWFPVTLTEAASTVDAVASWPASFQAMHWHAETYSLPAGAVPLARSEAVEQQAFAYQDHVLGLQFHLELGPGDVTAIAEACPGDLDPGPWVQTTEEMLADPDRFSEAQGLLDDLLAAWIAEAA